ncbi:MAG TPA: hypothetical protein VIG75_13555 [Citricoccus sp.]
MTDVRPTSMPAPVPAGAEDPRSRALPVGQRALLSRAANPVLRESLAIWLAIASAVAGAVVGIALFDDRRPLSGDGSVGVIAAVVGGSCAGTACLVGFARSARTTHQWMTTRHWSWLVADALGLLVVHAAIAVMACLALFRLFQEAFTGLTVDRVAATVMLTIVSAVAGYLGFNSAARISTRSLSSLLAAFMASGMIVSMLLAENPFWWHAFFSELGTGQAGILSFWTFNTTLTVSGLVLTTLSSFITQDLFTWARARESAGRRRARIAVLRWGLVVIGLCMMGAGIVPINFSDPVHSTFIRILGVVFVLMLATIQLWLPGFPPAVYVASYLMVALGVAATLLWYPLRYYNLTGFELAMAGIVYAWLVVFIRNLDAVLTVAGIGDAERDEGGEVFSPAHPGPVTTSPPAPAAQVPDPQDGAPRGRASGTRSGPAGLSVTTPSAPPGSRPPYRGWRIEPGDRS